MQKCEPVPLQKYLLLPKLRSDLSEHQHFRFFGPLILCLPYLVGRLYYRNEWGSPLRPRESVMVELVRGALSLSPTLSWPSWMKGLCTLQSSRWMMWWHWGIQLVFTRRRTARIPLPCHLIFNLSWYFTLLSLLSVLFATPLFSF